MHKCILVARFPHFVGRVLQNNFNLTQFSVDGFSYDVFLALIRLVYTDRVIVPIDKNKEFRRLADAFGLSDRVQQISSIAAYPPCHHWDELDQRCQESYDRDSLLASDMQRLFVSCLSEDDDDDAAGSASVCDVAFRFHGTTKLVKSCKAILAARSHYFKAMFATSFFRESSEYEVKLSADISRRTFKGIIEFLFTGSIDLFLSKMKMKKEDEDEDEDRVIMKLLWAATQYALFDLGAMCEQRLAEHLSAENALSYLAMADAYGSLHLKSACFTFIAGHRGQEVKRRLKLHRDELTAQLIEDISEYLNNSNQESM